MGIISWIRQIAWVELYKGKDIERFKALQTILNSNHIAYQSRVYNTANRLFMQPLQSGGMRNNRGPYLDPAAVQFEFVNNDSLDVYCIEVKKRDLVEARRITA